MTLTEKFSDIPILKCGGRVITDFNDRPVVVVNSTYRDGGTISPCEADILGKMISAYLESNAFYDAWPEAVRKHFEEA